MSDLYEKLASIQHEIWASWQKYVHNHKLKSDPRSVGFTLSVDDVDRWNRQIITPYSELTEKEKDSDRKQVDKFWHLIEKLQAPFTMTTAVNELHIISEIPDEIAVEPDGDWWDANQPFELYIKKTKYLELKTYNTESTAIKSELIAKVEQLEAEKKKMESYLPDGSSYWDDREDKSNE